MRYCMSPGKRRGYSLWKVEVGHRRLFRGDDPELILEGTLGLNQVGMWKEGRGKNDIPDREPVCVKTEQWEKAW